MTVRAYIYYADKFLEILNFHHRIVSGGSFHTSSLFHNFEFIASLEMLTGLCVLNVPAETAGPAVNLS